VISTEGQERVTLTSNHTRRLRCLCRGSGLIFAAPDACGTPAWRHSRRMQETVGNKSNTCSSYWKPNSRFPEASVCRSKPADVESGDAGYARFHSCWSASPAEDKRDETVSR
jgi:hypothetical protein